jgi:hypothetical protein
MKSAVFSGYITVRPENSISLKATSKSDGFTVFMAQFNSAESSDIHIYQESMIMSENTMTMSILHELMHATSLQEKLIAIERPNLKLRGQKFNEDPKIYYDTMNANPIRQVKIGSPKNTSSTTPSKSGVVSIPTQYTDNLYEGNVNNWYPTQILKALRLN